MTDKRAPDARATDVSARAAPPYSGRAIALLGSVTMAAPSASFLCGLVPWWRAGDAGSLPAALLYAVVLAGWIGVHLVIAWGGPWHRHPLGPPAVIAALTLAVLLGDVVLGSRLGLTSLLGVQPGSAARFFGMGNVGFGVVSAAALVLAGALAALLHRRRGGAVAAVLVLGLVVAAVDGAPTWGADFGGVPAILLATGVLALAAGQSRLTPLRVLAVAAAGLVGATAVLVADWLRPAADRTHLGRFVQTVLDGDAGAVVADKLRQSLALLQVPLSWVAVAALAVLVTALLAPRSALGRWTAPLWRVPMARATAWSLVTVWVVGWALNDSGIALVGAGLVVAVAAAATVVPRLPRPSGALSPRPGPSATTPAPPVGRSDPAAR